MRLLATGAMSEVWEDPARPEVVLKRVRADQARNPVFVHQLRAEAEALRRVDHPAVLRLVAETPEGLWLERGTPCGRDLPPVDVRAAWVDRLVGALGEVHRAGVVHRDVKGENLLLTSRGVVLGDFGCARIDGWPDPAPGLGSPEAMAPERLHGAAASPASDWFALGVLAWTWFTASPPFPSRRFREVEALQALGLPPFVPVVPGVDEGRLRRWLSPVPAQRVGRTV